MIPQCGYTSRMPQLGLTIVHELSGLLSSLRDLGELDKRNIYNSQIRERIATLRSVAEDMNGRAYVREKITAFEWSVQALAGINDGNENTQTQHESWARIALSTLKNLFEEPASPIPPCD